MIVAARSWLGRRRPGRHKKAVESVRFIVGDSVPEQELDALADAYLKRASWRAEARIRPRLINSQEVVGHEHLAAALAEGRGCLLSFMHHGDYLGSFGSIVRCGTPLVIIGDSVMFDPKGRFWHTEYKRAAVSVPGTSMLDVAIGSAGIREQLQAGSVVAIAVDFPGHTPTRIFGHDLMLSSGGVRIAAQLDAPVVAMTAERAGSSLLGGARTVLSPPMHPHDFAGPEELHAELVRTFEASIVKWPEAMEEPLRMDYDHLVRKRPEQGPASGAA